MISKEIIKSEISNVPDRYLEVLYRIIKAFEYTPVSKQENRESNSRLLTDREWISFVESTYGCLSDDPVERGEQGVFEIREAVD
ncbi:MAG: hypothetical protein AB7S75_06415 [Desulfococcaceae bacterium]